MKKLFMVPLCLLLSTFALGAPKDAPKPLPKVVVWFDLDTNDADKAMKFFGPLLGWTFEKQQVDGYEFYLVKVGGDEAGTLDPTSEPLAKSSVAIYFEVEDLQAKFAQAVALGANVIYPPMAVPNGRGGAIAMVESPDGQRIGLYSEKAAK